MDNITQYRIVKRAGSGVYVIEALTNHRWAFVTASATATLEEARKMLADVLAHGEPQDEVIEVVNVPQDVVV